MGGNSKQEVVERTGNPRRTQRIKKYTTVYCIHYCVVFNWILQWYTFYEFCEVLIAVLWDYFL